MTCIDLLGSIKDDLKKHNTTYSKEHIMKLVFPPVTDDVTTTAADEPIQKRQRQTPRHFEDSVVTCPLPQFRDTASTSSNHDVAATDLRSLGVDIVDALCSELDGRFAQGNVKVWDSFQALSPVSDEDNFLDAYALTPLLEYVQTIPYFRTECRLGENLDEAIYDLRSECRLFKPIFLAEYKKFDKDEKLLYTEKFMRICESRPSIRVLKVLFQVATTAGFSTSTVEAVFSARARIDTPSRRRLTPYKQGNLTLLHFERRLTRSVTFDDFLSTWVKLKPRRLRL